MEFTFPGNIQSGDYGWYKMGTRNQIYITGAALLQCQKDFRQLGIRQRLTGTVGDFFAGNHIILA